MSTKLYCTEGDEMDSPIPSVEVMWVRRWQARRAVAVDDRRVLEDLLVPVHAHCFDPAKHRQV